MTDGQALQERIQRLEARVDREKAARQEAETIAERVTSERFVLHQQLEDRLALRTTELAAARRAAAEAAAERDRVLSEVSHNLRTLLTALFFALESARDDEPLGQGGLAEVRTLLAEMRKALDEQAFTGDRESPSSATDPEPGASVTGTKTLSGLLEEHEEHWHHAAARAGKLLMVDMAPGSANHPAGDPGAVNERVLAVIGELADTAEPVVELRLVPGVWGDVEVEVAAP